MTRSIERTLLPTSSVSDQQIKLARHQKEQMTMQNYHPPTMVTARPYIVPKRF